MGVTAELAGKITGVFVRKGIVAEEDACLYKYGIESSITIAGNLLASLIFGLVTGRLGNIMVFLFFYGMLRSFSGGMHCKSKTGCFLVSILILFIPAYICDWAVRIPLAVVIAGGITSLVVILILSPVESINKPLDDGERKYCRNISRGIAVWQVCMLAVLYGMEWRGYFYAGYSSLLLVAIFMAAGKILYKCK